MPLMMEEAVAVQSTAANCSDAHDRNREAKSVTALTPVIIPSMIEVATPVQSTPSKAPVMAETIPDAPDRPDWRRPINSPPRPAQSTALSASRTCGPIVRKKSSRKPPTFLKEPATLDRMSGMDSMAPVRPPLPKATISCRTMEATGLMTVSTSPKLATSRPMRRATVLRGAGRPPIAVPKAWRSPEA
jgi:hypothetical protein